MADDTLIPTKETPGAFDALEKARPDEPIFTLLGRDLLAPALVQNWCDNKRKAALLIAEGSEQRELELRQIAEAERIAWAMTEYRRGDLQPVEVREPAAAARDATSYSGYEQSADARSAEDMQKLIVECVRRIDNSVAEMTETAERLIAADMVGPISALPLFNAILLLKSVAKALRPARRV